MAAHLYDQLLDVCTRPAGIAHLERADLTTDLTMARDFDLGMMGPPLDISMDFISSGLVDLVVGASAAVLLLWFEWWAAPVLAAAWIATHWLLRESGVWRDRNTDEVRKAQRHADYSYRLAVDAAPAKELRLFGLAGWVADRFVATRRRLYDLQYEATRLREKSVAMCLAIVLAANLGVFVLIADAAADGSVTTGQLVVYVQAAIGVSAIAFGGLNWALDGAAAPVAALTRLERAVSDDLDASGTAAPPASGAVDPVPRRVVQLSRRGPARARRVRPHDPGRHVDRDRRCQRRRQDDARQAAVPPVRPDVGFDRDRRPAAVGARAAARGAAS